MKNETPTPRTDARHVEMQMQDLQIGHQLSELINFARQLERELNEANNTSRAMVTLHDEQEKEIEQLCEERDQLRKVADNYAQAWKQYGVFPSLGSARLLAIADAAYSQLPHVMARKTK